MKDFHHQHGEDLHEEQQMINDHQDGEIWLDRHQDDFFDVNDASIFYGDFTPHLDFPCMSSSPSSSSTRVPLKSVTDSTSSSSASSSAASLSVLKSDAEEDVEKRNDKSNYHHDHYSGGYPQEYQHQVEHEEFVEANTGALSSTASMEIPRPSDQGIDGIDCVDSMETFGYMDLLEGNDFFYPSSMFQADDNFLEEFQQGQKTEMEHGPPPNETNQGLMNTEIQQSGGVGEDGGGAMASDDIAMVFLEWLKSNKETVSAEDLRKVKIKKATIDCAARRLGGGKEGMKQLLKLILEWVQTNHLQKRLRESSSSINVPIQNPNPSNLTPTPNPCDPNSLLPDQTVPCFAQPQWVLPPSPYDPAPVLPGFQPFFGYMADPFVNAPPRVNNHQYPPPPDYHMLDSSQSWSSGQFTLASHYPSFGDNNMQHAPTNPNPYSGYGNQYTHQYLPGHSGDALVRLGSSATKEARRKRMARQRRYTSYHKNHSSHHQKQQYQNSHEDENHGSEQHARNDNVAPLAAQANPPNWVYWPPPAATPIPSAAQVMPVKPPPVANTTVEKPATQNQNFQRKVVASDRRQGWKPEKNLRFVLQKVLKQSDVGNLGRIVLPKKEAETHLPELEARDGISIAMEDIGTSRVWNMRYRYWPNNKSRMYLLENTGDFVRTNGLQEGDFIVIYSDVKCGKYLIRGMKVRQSGPKQENKRAGKSQKSVRANSPAPLNGTPSSTPTNQTQTLNHNTEKLSKTNQRTSK